MTKSFSLSGDLAHSYVVGACVLAAISVALLLVELWRQSGRRGAGLRIGISGALAVVALLLAVLRPVAILSKGSLVGPRVVVLVDGSRSIDLPGLDGTRRQAVDRAISELEKRSSEVRASWLRFGDGPPTPLATPGEPGGEHARPMSRSDLGTALEAVANASDERPSAIVVLSDGRLDRPTADAAAEQTRAALGGLGVPVHTVGLASAAPRDASIRAVRTAGAAVAHQPLSLRIEIGCEGALACDELHVSARELRERGEPTATASGVAHVAQGTATVELTMTLDRAGPRILQVDIDTPDGDEIPDNNRRYVSVDVARDRVRVLHVAGRPTYDVRALRMWLKSDASVDVVAFFILRTQLDQVNATQDELALIPFPVDELFKQHLPSFDAVVLQDFDAAPYGLTPHLARIANYVEKGGGLIMVGGPDAFTPGHYAGTEIARVLPVDLERDKSGGVDLAGFVPTITEAGRAAPVLAPLRALIGDELPEMPGTNVVDDPRPGATVLLEHPTRKTKSGAPMPILALGEPGSGRSIALTIDGSHRLLFSAFAASAAGRAHGAFWDALLGWLMRDARFEPAVIEARGGCIAGEDTVLAVRALPGMAGEAKLAIARLGAADEILRTETVHIGAGTGGIRDAAGATLVSIGSLAPGGYSATLEFAAGAQKGPATRRDFACEKGGDEWADSRPDAARLQAIARATGGTYVVASDAASLPLPAATQVASERHVSPILPPWAWTAFAAALLGAHWIVRRRGGLS